MNRFKYLIYLGICLVFFSHQSGKAQTVVNSVRKDAIKIPGVTTDVQISSLTRANIETTNTYKDGLGRVVQTIALQASPNSNNDLVQVFNYNNLGQQPVSYLPYVDNTGSNLIGSYRTTGITDQATYYQNNSTSSNLNKVANDSNPYSTALFENSPLQRVLAAGLVGNGFQPGATGTQHYKTINYRSNIASDNVLQWDVTGYQLGQYNANVLSVTDATDEDGAETLSFMDVTGKIILSRKLANQTVNSVSEQYFDTYYIYNAAGLLSYIVPPKAVALMASSSNYYLGASNIASLIFSYKYNSLGQLVQKQMPGTTTPSGVSSVNIIYDPMNRPVLIQDANLNAKDQWVYIKYDYKGRKISQGIYTDHTNKGPTAMQTYVNGLTGYTSLWYEKRNNALATGYYTNLVFPMQNNDGTNLLDLAYAYYDDYNLTQSSPNYVYQSAGLSSTENGTTYLETGPTTAPITGMPTIVRKRTIAPNTGLPGIWLINVAFYDKNLNKIQVQSNNQLNYTAATSTTPEAVTDYETYLPDFTGKILATKTIKNVGTGGTTNVATLATYDTHGDRLLYVDQSYNNLPSVRVASYEYNEMGQLVKKNLEPFATGVGLQSDVSWGPSNSLLATDNKTLNATNSITFSPGPAGSTGAAAAFVVPQGATFTAAILPAALQSVDLRYNIRGQLLSINNSQLTDDGGITNNDSNDLFGMQLMYDQPDAALNGTVSVTPSYSGRISAVKWMTVDNNRAKTNERSSKYTYDLLNRLTASNYAERAAGSTGNFNINQGGFDETGIAYDENGNILSLNRNLSTIGASAGTAIDQLAYSYSTTSPNQLLNVSDAGNSTNPQYVNYGFQNLTSLTTAAAANTHYTYDNNGNLTNDPYKGLTIAYNIFNKTDNIQFTYNATNRHIDYTYDASGNIIRKQQYDNGSLITTTDYIDGFVYLTTGTATPALSYFPMAEGRVVNNNGTLTPEYIITDQQGNARFSFQDDGNKGVKIIQENSYYAFGLAIPNSPVSVTLSPDLLNKRLYNGGSEWQNDFSNLPNYYQTFNRNYDPTIGRFIGVDPEADAAHMVTPYQYANNNPITFNDPLGNAAKPNTIADDGDGDNTTTVSNGGGDIPPATGDNGDPGQDGPGSNGYQGGTYYYYYGQNGTKLTEEKPIQHYKYSANSPAQLVDGDGSPTGSPTPVDGLTTYASTGSDLQDGTFSTPPASLSTGDLLTYEKFGFIENNQPIDKIGDPNAAELAKYGELSHVLILSIGASYGAPGAVYEKGIVYTSKGWARPYTTKYVSPGLSSPAVTAGMTFVVSLPGEHATFSNWSGAMIGFSGSLDYISANVGFNSTYAVFGIGLSYSPTSLSIMKDVRGSGSFNMGITTWDGPAYLDQNWNPARANERFIYQMRNGGY